MIFRLKFLGLLLSAILVTSCKAELKKESSKKPNVLFIMSDDHAYQAISAYQQNLISTPNIDRIADQGILFNKAFVTNSICGPSRAVILTGKYSHLNGFQYNGNIFDGAQQTLPKLMQQNGYQTAMIGKWHLKSSPTGFDYYNVLPGQGDYYNPDFIKKGKDTIYQGYVTDIITDLSLDWLEQRDTSKPFFMMMQHKAPHRNWMPALKNMELFNDKEFELPGNYYDNYEGRQGLQQNLLTVYDHTDIRMDQKVPCETCDTLQVNHWAPGEYTRRMARLTPYELQQWEAAYNKEAIEYESIKHDKAKLDKWKFQRYMEDYLRCIASVDESVGEVLDYLKKNDLENNTIVVYTSDQGFYLGEHGLFDKRFMYEEAMRTPLVMRYPKEIKQSTQSDLMVQNLDFAPTLLDVAGIKVPEDMQGNSMRKIWKEESPDWKDTIYYHYYENGYGATPHYGVRTDRYKLIHYYEVTKSWELFDLHNDPSEMDNLYDNPQYTNVVSQLKEKIKTLQEQYKVTF